MNNKQTILLVEDEAIIALSTAKIIKKHGFTVITADNGEKAVKIMEENQQISLTLMDIDLGEGMDGTEAAKKILESHDIPIIFHTSHSEKDYVDRVKEITRYGYVLKNSGEFVLIESINMAYELFEANQQRKRHEQELENTVEELRSTNEQLIQKEEDLRKNNRALRTLSECNQILVRDITESELVQKICDVIVEKAGFRLCWVGYIEGKGKERIVVPAAHSGFGKDYVESLKIEVDVDPSSKGPTATAARTNEPSVVNHILDNPDYKPWREAALQHGYQSSIALPLMEKNEVFAVLNIYAAEADVFREEERKLLIELSEDLSYGIRNIRTKQEKEQKEGLLDNIIENIPVGLQIFDRDGYSFRINKKQKELLGLSSEEEGIGEFNVLTDPYSIAHGADKLYGQVYNGNSFIDMENEYNFDVPVNNWETRKEKRFFNESIFPIFNKESKVDYVVSLLSDITEKKQMVEDVKASEEKFSSLFNSMTEGVCIHQMLYTDSGAPYDYIIKDVNPAYEKILNLSKDKIVEKLSTEVYHTKEPPFLDIYSNVIETKKPYQFETYYVPMDKHFLVSTFSMDHESFATVFMDITEQKRTEESLRITLDSIGDAVISTDVNGAITRMNPVAERLTGWSGNAAKDKSLKEAFHIINADTREIVDNPVEEVLQRGVIVGLANHTVLISKDGREYQIADSAAPIKDDDGNINGVVLVFRDVTEEYEKERQITENEKKYRGLFNSIRDAILVADTDRNFIDCNPAFTDLFGYSFEEIQGKKTVSVYKSEEEYTQMGKALKEHNGELKDFLFPVHYRRKDGTTFIGETNVFYLRDDTDKVIGFIGLIRDITERKQAEEKLNSQNTLLSMIMETSPVGIVTVDKTGNIAYANKRAEEILGLVKDEITSRTYDAPLWNHTDLDGSPFPDERQPYNIVKTTMSTAYNIQHGITWPDGTVVLLSINASPMKDIHGKFNGMVATIEDISDAKNNEQVILQQLAEKDYLMKELNHRVKNNLAMISSLISLKNSETDADLSDLTQRIDVIKLVHEKLYQQNDVEHIDVKEYFRELVESIFSSTSECEVDLINNIEEMSIPAKTALPLGLVINEIATNAIKYGFASCKEARFIIEMKRDPENKQYVLTLSNTGNPFPEEIGLENPETMGLQLVSALVKQLKGTIELQKKPYPVFTIRFPVKV